MKCLLIIVILVIAVNGYSQQLPVFRPLRYDEDYSILRADSTKTFYRKLKYTPLIDSRKSYVSFGGEARLQYIYYKNDLWSDAPEATHGEVLNRYLVHGDIHVGKYFRTFAQLQSSMAFGKEQASPLDDNSLELHQAFIDLKSSLNGKGELIVRMGRQEFYYGSQRLISAREGPNNRQSFDGLKFILHKRNLRTDIFYSQHVTARNGIFNDRPSANIRLFGVYVEGGGIPILSNVDVYYLGLLKRQAIFDDGTGREVRYSAGTRIWNNTKDLKYDFEAVYQFGKMGKKVVRAWTVSLNSSYTFSKRKLQPRVGLKTELISGDQKYDDHKLQTFNPLFPRGGYFGLAGLIGPENLIGIHPSVSFTPVPGLSASFDYDMLWRYSMNDGLYAPSSMLIYTGRNAMEKHVGNQYSLILDYSLNKFFSFSTVLTWFDAGDYLKVVSPGKDVVFMGLTTQAKF